MAEGASSTLGALHVGLQGLVREGNWKGLRPIQEAAFAALSAGLDCVIEAPTAGGKTEAVLFPTLTRAAEAPQNSVQILYIAPLRALLNNLETRAEKYARACGLEAFKWHGDVSQTAKIKTMRRPPQLLLTTPESIEAILLRRSDWEEFFSELQTVIIDEAHNFAAGDRGSQLLSLLERLEAATGRRPQRVALSATIGNPDAMCQWLMGTRDAAQRIAIKESTPKPKDYVIRHYLADESDDTDHRLRLLDDLADELLGRRSLVFVHSRRRAEEMATAIDTISHARVRVRTHHSNVSKYFREEAEKLIQLASEEGINAIVSTSTLELGIDIGNLDGVVQLGSLSSPSSFLQRVGRTGRRDDKGQYFRGITQAEEELLLLTATVSLGLEHKSEALKLRRRAFHILAHQILCLSLQNHGITPESGWVALRNTYSFSGIMRDEYDLLIRGMVAGDFLRQSDGVLVAGEQAEKQYLMANWRRLFATFESAPLYDVYHGNNQVGTLDVSFVSGLEVPFVFVLAGKRWIARKIDHDARTVRVQPSSDGTAPRWKAFSGPGVPFETAQRVGELLYGFHDVPDVLNDAGKGLLDALQVNQQDRSWRPRGLEYVVIGGGNAVLRTFAGDAINMTLSRVLSETGLKVDGDFMDLKLSHGPDDSAELRSQVMATIEEVASQPIAVLQRRLLASQRAYRFSPFSVMLPESLKRAALVDLMTEPEGTIDYLCRALGQP